MHNTALAPTMVCSENKSGSISCATSDQEVTFKVEEINDGDEIIDEFMDVSCNSPMEYSIPVSPFDDAYP